MNTYTKQGMVSSYGLACGVVQSKIVAGQRYGAGAWQNQVKVELYQEGGVYHVKRYENGTRTMWGTYETLAEARWAFRAIDS